MPISKQKQHVPSDIDETMASHTIASALSEAQLHLQVFNYLEWALGDNAIVFHIPNGGSRNKREAANLKKLGTKAGVPDLEILHRGRAFFIEIKAKKGSLSASQKRLIPMIERAECPVAECRSLEDVITFLHVNRIPIRKENLTTERIRSGLAKAMEGANA